jgi:ELWxxDGT repeat protein
MAPALGALYFRGTAQGTGSSTVGSELFVTDGTTTRLVKDIVPGSGSSFPADFIPVRSVVVFQATTPSQGTELWFSDGSEAGTMLLKDIFDGTGSGIPPAL